MLAIRNNCFKSINNDVDVLQQLKEFGVWEEEKPLRLHLGCGQQHFDDYVNIDFPQSEHNLIRVKADIYADIKSLHFPPDSVDEIRLHHVFEHFNRVTALVMLIKWHRWLKPGGRLLIETPDLMNSAKTLISDVSWKTKMGVVRHLAGDQTANWGYHIDHWFAERFEHTLRAFDFKLVETLSNSWPKEPYLSNLKVVAIKSKSIPLQEQIQVAEKLLWESTVCPEEKPKWEVWKNQLKAALAGNFVTSPSNAQTPDISSILATPTILSHNSNQLPLEEIHGFNKKTRNRWVQAKSRTVPAGSRVLDVGAGTCPYRPFFTHCDYKTHDFEKYKGIKKNNTTEYGQIDYKSDITNIPVPDESFDVIICTEVLEHVPEPIEALREMARILKHGGDIFVTAPLGSGLHQLPYHYYGGLSPQWYKHFFPKFGLQLKEISPNGGFFKLLAQECARVQWTLPQHQHLHGSNVEFIRHLFGEWLPRYLFGLEEKCFIDQFTVGYHVEATKNTDIHSINDTINEKVALTVPSNRQANSSRKYTATKDQTSKLFFIHIPKTGGSYIRQYETDKQPVISHMSTRGHTTIIEGKTSATYPPATGFLSTYVTNRTDIIDFSVFAVVRNIFSWLVSYAAHAGGFNPQYQDLDHYDYKNTQKGFDFLIKTIANRDGEIWPCRKFIHFQIFSDNGKLVTDYLPRNETLDKDLRQLSAKLNLNYTRKQKQRIGKHSDYRSYYTDSLIELVYETWGRELSLFGYTFDGIDISKATLKREIDANTKENVSYLWDSDTLKINKEIINR